MQDRIFIVKIVAGSYEDRIEKNIRSFANKAKAQEYADGLNEQYECIVDLDLYCDSEIYVSNEIIDKLSNYDSFYKFGTEMMNIVDRNSSAQNAWYLLEGIYAAYKDVSWHDFVYSLLYDKEGNLTEDYSYWFAVLLKIFCCSLDCYTLEDVQKSVAVYQETWTQPHAFVEELEFVS